MCKRILKEQTSLKGDIPFYKIGTFGKKADSFISKDLFNEYKANYPYPKKGDILISCSGTIGRTVEFDGKPSYFQDSNIVWLENDETKVINKYLKYFYERKPWQVASGGTISRLYNDNILKTEIIIPPIKIQEKIVDTLDNFEKICNDLNIGLPAEIEARQKQYEFYRDLLLTFAETGDTISQTDRQSIIKLILYVFGSVLIPLEWVAEYEKQRIPAGDVTPDTYVGVENLLQNKHGKTNATYVPSDGQVIAFYFDDILIGNIRPYLRKIWMADCDGGTNGDVLAIRTTASFVFPRYLYHILASEDFFVYDTQHSKGAKMPRGDKDAVMRYRVRLYSKDKQIKIADILDNFSKITSDLEEGLPAEIEARKKQYEYYRDKLLTFKEKVC